MTSTTPSPSALFDGNHARQLCPDGACIGVLKADRSCPECGAIAGDDLARGEELDVDLLHRNLCPDGSCIGLLGSDGRCKECGRVGAAVTTDPRLRGLKDEDAEEAPPDPVPTEAPEAPEAPAAVESTANLLFDETPAEFAQRRLCPDGSCIGVIGEAGTCNECSTVA